MRLYEYLSRHAAEAPSRLAVDDGQRQLTYGELEAAVAAEATRLRQAHGVGEAIVLRAMPSVDFLVGYLAIHRAGCVAVPLSRDASAADEGAIRQQLDTCTLPQDAADVLFTTGTTGRQKGVIVSHRAIIADAENLIAGQGFHRDLAFVISGPMNHIGSLSKLWPMLIVGGQVVITEGLKDMPAFFAAIQRQTLPVATFLVPASIRMLLQFGRKELNRLARQIEFIETGAAPIAEADMQRLREALPQSRLFNTYASTETGIISTYDYAHHPVIAGCLGRPMPHSAVSLGADGCLICSGDTLMSGYVDSAATAAVLHDGHVFTADRATLDAEGNIHLQGRQDDLINVGGYKVSPVEVEDAALAFPGVADCICIAADHPVIGTVTKLLYHVAEGQTVVRRDLARFLAARLERYKVPQLYAEVPEVHRTFNGKLDRKYYQHL